MQRNSVKLNRGHQAWLYSATALIYITGVAWAWLHYFKSAPAEDFASPSSAEPWMLKLHGAGAMLILVVIGTLLPRHVRSAWYARRNRPNGITLLAVFAFLTVTGYGLYYFGDERLRSWTSWLHLWIGIGLPALLILHIWQGRRSTTPKRPTV